MGARAKAFALFFILYSNANPPPPARLYSNANPWPPPAWSPGSLLDSLYLYGCTNTGPLTLTNVSGWRTVNIDWSTSKEQWAKARPMNAEELLIENARALAAGGHRAMVYRNVAKALPWFTSVRSVLGSPAHAAWFMPFGANKTVNGSYHVPSCDKNYNPPLCSALYHDRGCPAHKQPRPPSAPPRMRPQHPPRARPQAEEQTPGYPGGDGTCSAPACDVGAVPVGEYLFNPLSWNVSVNGTTLGQWFIEDYLFGPNGMGDGNVSGAYFDDYWQAPFGPSEMEAHAAADMGLDPAAIAALAAAFQSNMAEVYAAMRARGKVAEQQMFSPPRIWRTRACASVLLPLCGNATSPTETGPALFDLGSGLPAWQTELAVAEFLLARGNWSFLGHKWGNCGCSCPLPPPVPDLLSRDVGAPLGLCYETARGSGVFARNYTRAAVSIDCTAGPNATITFF